MLISRFSGSRNAIRRILMELAHLAETTIPSEFKNGYLLKILLAIFWLVRYVES
jgi:hypothetical protein